MIHSWEGFCFFLKIIYQTQELSIDFLCKRKFGFPFGFGEIKDECKEDDAGSSKQQRGEGIGVCGRETSLIIREGKRSLPRIIGVPFSSGSLLPLCARQSLL